MLSRLNPWLLGGIVLDLVGIVLVVQSMPEGGTGLAVGAACLVLGTLAVVRGSQGDSGPAPRRSNG